MADCRSSSLPGIREAPRTDSPLSSCPCSNFRQLLRSGQSASLGSLSLGCPVIASAIEGVDEQLGNAALYVNPDSVSELVDAILRLSNEQGLREFLITAGKKRASELTADGYAAELIDLLDTLELRFGCFRR